jgi:hypothetical protein
MCRSATINRTRKIEEEPVTRLRTRHMAAVLSVAAIVAAGCGSSSSSKSAAAPATPSTPSTPSTTSTTGGANLPPAVKSELTAALKPVQAAGQQITAKPADPNSYSHAATAFRDAATAIQKIKVPASDQAKVTKFVALLNQGAGDLDKLATDVKNKDQAALQTDLKKFQATGQEINALKGQ